MSLILNKTAILSASKVLDKTKEILEVWRDIGNSINLPYSIPAKYSIEGIIPNDNLVIVKIEGK